MGSDWQPYIWERVIGGVLITGCKTRPKQSGPNTGTPMFLIRQDNYRALVTHEAIDRMLEQAKVSA
ncbi:hypothetical protein [Salinisphaera sp. T31B1]|uniref:hypothetical protein n=1 Tax=Salinisphaera sp. T31B1 TaxID=727963 RepID=UPI00333E221E